MYSKYSNILQMWITLCRVNQTSPISASSAQGLQLPQWCPPLLSLCSQNSPKAVGRTSRIAHGRRKCWHRKDTHYSRTPTHCLLCLFHTFIECVCSFTLPNGPGTFSFPHWFEWKGHFKKIKCHQRREGSWFQQQMGLRASHFLLVKIHGMGGCDRGLCNWDMQAKVCLEAMN